MLKTKLFLGLFCAGLLLDTANATADDVVLKTRDGGSWATGSIVAMGNETILLSTRFGEMQIIRNNVYCEGQACPQKLTRAYLAKTASPKSGFEASSVGGADQRDFASRQ